MAWYSGIVNWFVKGSLGKIFGKQGPAMKDDIEQDVVERVNSPGFFTRFVDGVNRLVRPIFSYGVIGFFAWAVIDPTQFAVSMQALALIPDFMYGIFLTIVSFWFGGRIFEKYADAKLRGPSANDLQTMLNNQKEILKQNGLLLQRNTEQAATVDTTSTPNPVVNQIVDGHYGMEPIYEDDEKRPEKSLRNP